MSFSVNLKQEIAGFTSGKRCCMIAELSAIASLNLTGTGKNNYSIVCNNPSVSKKIISLYTGLFSSHPDLTISAARLSRSPAGKSRKNSVKGHTYKINFGEKNLQSFNELGVLDDSLNRKNKVNMRLLAKKCCKRAYLRGVFLVRGSVTDPRKGQHLEIQLSDKTFSDSFERLTRELDIGFKKNIHEGSVRHYLKKADSIISFLAAIGGHDSALQWENFRIVKEVKNRANRLANCDSANVNKSIDASMRQIENIKKLLAQPEIRLSGRLISVCNARLAHPEIGLKDLGKKINPPISKSAIYHRLQRIDKLANRVPF